MTKRATFVSFPAIRTVAWPKSILPGLVLARTTRAAVALVLAMIPGCGYRRPALAPAQAVVMLDDKPVSGASVTLVPTASGRPSMGASDSTGRVVFSTYGSRDGAPPGNYKVVVVKLVLTKKAAARLEKLRGQRSAASDDGTEPMIEMQDDDYENLLPAKYARFGTTELAVTIDWKTREIPLELASEVASRGEAK